MKVFIPVLALLAIVGVTNAAFAVVTAGDITVGTTSDELRARRVDVAVTRKWI